MKEAEYLDGLRAATTAAELEAALHVGFKHSFHGAIWRRICAVRIAKGLEIVAAHPLSYFIPQFAGDRSRVLSLCGETFRVARGQNGAGVRYAWHAAECWAKPILRAQGFTQTATHAIWDGGWQDYPHRSLAIVERAVDGQMPDRPLNRLIYRYDGSGPIKCELGEDDRAYRPCGCGGTRFDWGCAWNGWSYEISWRCNRCPRVYVEWVTSARLTEIRTGK